MLAASDEEEESKALAGVPDSREWNGDAAEGDTQTGDATTRTEDPTSGHEATQRLMRIMRSSNGGGDLSAIQNESSTNVTAQNASLVADLNDEEFSNLVGGVVKQAVDKALSDVISITPRVDARAQGPPVVLNRFDRDVDRDVSLLLQRGKQHWKALELGMQETKEHVSHTVANLTRFKQQEQAKLARQVQALKRDFRVQMAHLQKMFLGEAQDLVEQLKEQVRQAKDAHVRSVNRQVNILVDAINGGAAGGEPQRVHSFEPRPLRTPGALFSPSRPRASSPSRSLRHQQDRRQQHQRANILSSRNQNLDRTLRREVFDVDAGATLNPARDDDVPYHEKLEVLNEFSKDAEREQRRSSESPTKAVRDWVREGGRGRVELSDQSFARANTVRSKHGAQGLPQPSYSQMKKLDFLPSSSEEEEHDANARDRKMMARFGADRKRSEQLNASVAEVNRAVDREQEYVSPGKSRKSRKLYQAYTRRRQLRSKFGDVLHSSSDEDERTRQAFQTNFRRTFPSPGRRRQKPPSSSPSLRNSRSPYPRPERKAYANRLKQIHDTLFQDSSDEKESETRPTAASPSGISRAFQEHLLRLHNVKAQG